MAVLPMQRVSICALKKDRKAILEKILSMGIMEMNQVAEGEEGFGTMDTVSARLSFDKKAQTAEQALAVLETYAPEKQSIFASLAGKDLVEKEKFDRTVANSDRNTDPLAEPGCPYELRGNQEGGHAFGDNAERDHAGKYLRQICRPGTGGRRCRNGLQ